MLQNAKQKTSFDQFLFSNFKIKKDNRHKSIKSNVTKKRKVNSNKIKKTIVNDQKNITTLTTALDSIPNKSSLDVRKMVHQHENEWYHAFRDLQEEIAKDLSKKHPSSSGILKLKSEIKEFWEQFDEHIDKFILELERIFQVFPNLSRTAVLYSASILIAVPLVFFSINHKQLTYNNNFKGEIRTVQEEIPKFTKEMKATYVAEHSAEILKSGKKIIQVSNGLRPAKVAGAYEERKEQSRNKRLKRKVFVYYDYISKIIKKLMVDKK